MLSCDRYCITCDTASQTCLRCEIYFYLLGSSCISCESAISNCIECDTSTFCTYCKDNYIAYSTTLSSLVKECLYCLDAIEQNLCSNDCSNSLCVSNCSYLTQEDGKTVRRCKNYSSSSVPYYVYYIITFVIVTIVYFLYSRRRQRMRTTVFASHQNKCCNCLTLTIIDNLKYQTNCKGFLCLPCYIETIQNCKTGNYFRCQYCNKFVICFIDHEKKTENVYKYNIDSLNIVINEESKKNQEDIDVINKEAVDNKESERINDVIIFGNTNAVESTGRNIQIQEINQNNLSIKSNKANEDCGICLGEKPDAIIPCDNRPFHRLHKYCLSEYINNDYKQCPLCKTNLS